jgi:hypothetical protein
MIAPGSVETHSFESLLLLQGSLTVVLVRELGRRDVADRLQETAMIEPVDLLQRGILHAVEVPPRALFAHQLGLAAADDRLGQDETPNGAHETVAQPWYYLPHG